MSQQDDAKRLLVTPLELTRVQSEGAIARSPMWRSCCGYEIDSRLISFFSQLVISLIVLIFCVHQIAVLSDSQSSWAKMTATFIIGVWLPSPRASK